MLRVRMQIAALRTDIPKTEFVWQIFVPQLVDTPVSAIYLRSIVLIRQYQ